MISLPVWLPGPMFFPGGLCPLSHVPSGVVGGGVSVPAPMFLPGGSLSGGVSVQGRCLSRGLCLGSLSRRVFEGSLSRESLYQGDYPPVR